MPDSKNGKNASPGGKAKESEATAKKPRVVSRNLFLITTIALAVVAVVAVALYATQYPPLQASYNALLSERDALAANNTQLQAQYNAILAENQNLQTQYDSLASENQQLQEQYSNLSAIVSLQNSTTLQETTITSIAEGGSIFNEYELEYAGYIEIQFESLNSIHFVISNSDYNATSRLPASGSVTTGIICIPVLPGTNLLQIYNDDPAMIVVTYSMTYVY